MVSDKDIIDLADCLLELHHHACSVYQPLVDDICSRNASKDEVEHLLDYMLDFCCCDEFLLLFKRVCRKYFYQYPQMITEYIFYYREWYENDDNGE